MQENRREEKSRDVCKSRGGRFIVGMIGVSKRSRLLASFARSGNDGGRVKGDRGIISQSVPDQD